MSYTLPDGNVQISFSGGRTSGYMLHQILEANGDLPVRVRVVFSNTGREMPETLDFVQEVSRRWGVRVVWVEDAARDKKGLFNIVSHNSASRDGEPFERLIRRKKSCPDVSKRFCTTELKMLPARRYLLALGWKAWTNAVGIRADEAHRATPSKDKRVTRWHPLESAGITRQDIDRFWKSQPFDLKVAEGFGNCDGCFLKSERQQAVLAREHPERHAWWERMEEIAGGTFVTEYSKRELGNFVERQGDWIFDAEDALCQQSGGECTG